MPVKQALCVLGQEAQKGPLLFDGLPPAGGADSGPGGPLLFDDLPPASSGDAGSLDTSMSQTVKSEGKGTKRRAPEEENGSEELVEKKVCKASSVIFGLKGYVAERKGEREEMQDAHVILNDITEECSPPSSLITRVSYFAVFDGHGGIRASKFAAQNLHQNLIRKFPKGDVISVEKTVKRCLLDTFKHTDEEFLKQASSQKPAWKDGSTATCVLAVDNILYIANLGDSRAILCRFNEESQKHAALSLSKEHSPTQYEERMRIQKAGGNVRDGRVLGVLEVSRSIGDGQYKRCGVTSVPDIRRCQLTPNDRRLGPGPCWREEKGPLAEGRCTAIAAGQHDAWPGSFCWPATASSRSLPQKRPSTSFCPAWRMRRSRAGKGSPPWTRATRPPATGWPTRRCSGAPPTTSR
uniref:Integrin-linked kinase-associated serine/threonine phosphatase 2C n=1 Tax=Suricata suricatta TaxID=37032 RepID=A0A673T8A8_SURSU